MGVENAVTVIQKRVHRVGRPPVLATEELDLLADDLFDRLPVKAAGIPLQSQEGPADRLNAGPLNRLDPGPDLPKAVGRLLDLLKASRIALLEVLSEIAEKLLLILNLSLDHFFGEGHPARIREGQNLLAPREYRGGQHGGGDHRIGPSSAREKTQPDSLRAERFDQVRGEGDPSGGDHHLPHPKEGKFINRLLSILHNQPLALL